MCGTDCCAGRRQPRRCGSDGLRRLRLTVVGEGAEPRPVPARVGGATPVLHRRFGPRRRRHNISMFMGNVEANVKTAEALIAAFEAANPDVKIDLDSSGPTGAEGDNLTKTKLATGEMEDVFWYNSGSLFQALSPDKSLLNVGDAVGRLAQRVVIDSVHREWLVWSTRPGRPRAVESSTAFLTTRNSVSRSRRLGMSSWPTTRH